MDFAKYTQEYQEKGELSKETYDAIAKEYKLGKDVVDAWIEGQKALADKHTASVFARAGGEQKYMEIVKWASTNLSQDEIKTFNQDINARDGKWTTAMDALSMRYIQANGNTPALIDGGSNPSSNVSGFASRAQMTSAINDPRYQSDPAYREEVRQKIARSNF